MTEPVRKQSKQGKNGKRAVGRERSGIKVSLRQEGSKADVDLELCII